MNSGPTHLNDDVWVIVPCYNEGPVVRGVIQRVREHFPNVVAVDDGSRDNSAAEIAATGARLVQHPVNLGAGAAYQTGVDFALRDPDAQIFVTFDADGQHQVEDVVAMVHRIREVDVEVLIGSRFLGSVDGMSTSRRALLRAAITFERVTSGISLTDAHQGLRVFRRSFAQILDLTAHDMRWASEFLTRMSEHQTTFAEFPVHVRYTDYSRSKGQRSINSVNIGIDVLIDKVLRGR
ncbi:MAG: glycosyltransferase family 2 protein [Micrococcales bacterium]|nr:glycosyltransferase family 2 protein [Micrococcales bacterium]